MKTAHALVVSAIMFSACTSANAALIGPDNLVLSVSEGCPGRVTVRWEGAAPDHWAAIAFSLSRGRYVIPSIQCAGTELGLGTDHFGATRPFRTGSEGQGEFHPRITAKACGGYLQMIVVDGFPCTISEVVQIP